MYRILKDNFIFSVIEQFTAKEWNTWETKQR